MADVKENRKQIDLYMLASKKKNQKKLQRRNYGRCFDVKGRFNNFSF